jgi:hypothetical protein
VVNVPDLLEIGGLNGHQLLPVCTKGHMHCPANCKRTPNLLHKAGIVAKDNAIDFAQESQSGEKKHH